MMKRILAGIITLTLFALVAAQPAPGAMMTRSPIFDLMTIITALHEMEATTNHPLEAEQAAVILEVLQELSTVELLETEQAEAALKTIEETLTPQQLIWVDMRLLNPSQADNTTGRVTSSPQGGGAGATRIQGGTDGVPVQRGQGDQTVIGRYRSTNPFAEPPLSDTLQEFMEFLAQKLP